MALPRISVRSNKAALAVTLAVAYGCAATPGQPAEEVVKARAQQRWDALLKGDVEAAYRFLSPGSRAVITPEGYRESVRPGFHKAATVESVRCSTPESCETQSSVEYEFRGSRFKTPLADHWVRQEGNWWLVLK